MNLRRSIVSLSLAGSFLACQKPAVPPPAPVEKKDPTIASDGSRAPTEGAATQAAPAPAPVEAGEPTPVEPLPGRDCTPLWLAVDAAAAKGELCDPTHEKFLLALMRESFRIPVDATYDHPSFVEYLRGMQWSDDPEGLMSKPGVWVERFRAARAQSKAGKSFGPGASLNARAQFGDLQFIHALRADPSKPVDEALEDIERWFEFTWRVSIGDIAPDTRLGDLDIEGFSKLFPAEWTVARLLGAEKQGEVRKRAFGAFVHTLQDAFATSHLERATDDLGIRYVRNIGSITQGMHGGHAGDIGWREGWKEGALLWEVAPSMDEAFFRALDLVRLNGYERPWPAARDYIRVHVLPRR